MKIKKAKKGKKKKKIPKLVFLFVGVILLFTIWAINNVNVQATDIELIPYKEYMELLEKGEVNTVVYNDTNKYMTISLFDEKTRQLSEIEREQYDYPKEQLRRVYYPAGENFKKELLEQGVIAVEGGMTAAAIYSQYGDVFLYFIMLVGLCLLFWKSSTITMGGNVAIKAAPEDIDITFDDVIGHDEIKDDLKLLVKQIKNGDKVKDLVHGVLFEGGAGTGKTMLAKAIAHEAGVNFISVSSSNLVQMYVGLGAKRVRDIFEDARKNAPCVLFFDELDAVGEKRGSQRSHRENDQTINALLTEMDGFAERGDVLVIAATNRADDLDDALVRAGRFDRKVKVGIPTKWETRKDLFEHYLKKYSVADDVNTEVLAKQTVGFSGADIAAVCREARLVMFSKDGEQITHDNLEEAIDKTVFKGNRSNDEQHKAELELTAYHEAGHAVMNIMCGKPVSRISIMSMTSGVGGAVFQSDNEIYFETKESMEHQIMVCYAGRASEQIKYGVNNITDGAKNDISQATKLLMAYAGQYGFDERIGLIDLSVVSSVSSSGVLLEQISELSNRFYSDTVNALSGHYNDVETLASKLLEVKTLSGDEIYGLLNKPKT